MNNNSKWDNQKIIKWYISRKHIQNGEKKILELVDFFIINLICNNQFYNIFI
jgi:hypothetical protein